MKKKTNDQAGGVADKKNMNADSSASNEGSQQDPHDNNGRKLTDEEKETGHSALLGKKKENPKDGNIGKHNARGYK
jgi:hypothetical protein